MAMTTIKSEALVKQPAGCGQSIGALFLPERQNVLDSEPLSLLGIISFDAVVSSSNIRICTKIISIGRLLSYCDPS